MWDILQLKKDISVTIHHLKNFLSQRMLLSRRVSLIFSATYLQGENSINENKDRDSYFIDPFLIDPSKVSGPMSNIIFVPSFSEPELSSFGLAPEN